MVFKWLNRKMGEEINYKQNIKQPKIQTDKENKTEIKQLHLFYYMLFYFILQTVQEKVKCRGFF